jgi:hypothetical protein
MVTAGALSILGAVFYIPARRSEQERDRELVAGGTLAE